MFRGEPYESVSPLVKAILAVAAGGERYRLGHYGAITKVPRGNVPTENTVNNTDRSETSESGHAEYSLFMLKWYAVSLATVERQPDRFGNGSGMLIPA